MSAEGAKQALLTSEAELELKGGVLGRWLEPLTQAFDSAARRSHPLILIAPLPAGSRTRGPVLAPIPQTGSTGGSPMPLSPKSTLPLLVGAFVLTLLWAERRHPLRPSAEPGGRRLARNGVMAGLAGLTVLTAERPVVEPLARWVEARRFGLVQRLPIPSAWRDAISVVLMDYTLYLWHRLMHRWDSLYRLHQVHHADLDLDASTATRFHAGEMLASVPWRAAQVLLLGTSLRALRFWQRFTLTSILFHHSNARLPLRVERLLGKLVMTPRLHGIHHSIVRAEQDSNCSNGLALWDYLHGTRREFHADDRPEIGVPHYRRRDDVTLGKLLRLPRTPARVARSLPDDPEIQRRGRR